MTSRAQAVGAADGVVGRAVLDEHAVGTLGRACVPVASVPMKSPSTMLPVVPASEIYTPLEPLPEITSLEPDTVPPMMLLLAPA